MNLCHIETDEDRRYFQEWLLYRRRDRLAVDTETTGLDPWHDKLRLVQFGDLETGWALPYPEERGLIEYVLDLGMPLVFHHAKFDTQFFHNAGLPADTLADDTKIMLHLLDSSSSTSLKENACHRFGEEYGEGEQLLHQAMKKNKWTWSTVPKDLPEYWMYAALDTILTARLDEQVRPLVEQMYPELYQMEIMVTDVIARAERRGMQIDVDYIAGQSAKLFAEIEEIKWRWPLTNLNSPTQVGEILEADGFKLARTKTGKPRVTAEDLEAIDHPLAKDVVAFRQASKSRETYFENFLEMAVDGRIHPTINTIGPRTGRMSSERPNLQNVPRGSEVRPSFTASPGCTLLSADYAQIEYRIFASIANEPQMIEAFLAGKDLHAETARIVYGHEPEPEERSTAKNANFATLFCAGIERFAETAGIPIPEARDFREKYEERFPGVKKFVQAVIKYTQANGMAVDTAYGRRCPVDSDHIYAGVNYMIQGTAADVLKQAIVRVGESEWDEYFILPVHDELIFDVPNELVAELEADLPDLMEERERFAVPLTIETKRQYRWGIDEEEEAIAA